MNWDAWERIIVTVIVAFSAAYLMIRLFRAFFNNKQTGDICSDCPTRSGCERLTRQGGINKSLERCGRGVKGVPE